MLLFFFPVDMFAIQANCNAIIALRISPCDVSMMIFKISLVTLVDLVDLEIEECFVRRLVSAFIMIVDAMGLNLRIMMP